MKKLLITQFISLFLFSNDNIYPKNINLINNDLKIKGYYIDKNISKPKYKKSINEIGKFDTKIIRVTDNSEKKLLIHHYSKDAVWNCNSKYMILGKTLLDATTFNIIKKLSSKKRWSNIYPNIRYGIKKISKYNFSIVKEYIPSGDTETLYKLKDKYVRLTIGEYEGNIDYNDNYIVLTGLKKENIKSKIATIILYNLKTKKVVIKDFNGRNRTKKLFIDKKKRENRLNWATISPLGKYIVIHRYDNIKKSKEKTNQNIHIGWNKRVEKYSLNLEYIDTISYKGGHGDLCVSENGLKEYLVQFETKGNGTENKYINNGDRGIWEYDLESGKRDIIVKNHGGGHVSCRNHKRKGWAYISYKTLNPKYRDIFAIKLGDKGLNQRGERVINRFAKARYMKKRSIGYKYYDQSPHACPNPNGSKVIFKSNWNIGNNILDDFIVEKK